MIDSTTLAVINERPAGTAQLVVEADAGRQTQEALQYALPKASQRAGSVTLESKDILAGPEDRFDPLADGCQVRTLPGFIRALGPHHACPQALDPSGELSAHVSLVAQKDFPARALAATQEFETHLPLVSLGRGQLKGSGCSIRGEDPVQTKAPEVTGMAGAVSIVGRVGKSGTLDGLPASGALHRGGVDKQEVISKARAHAGKDPEQPFDGVCKPTPALVISGLAGKLGEQVDELPPRRPQKAPVRRDTEDGLSHAKSDNLGIGCAPAGVGSLWQKVIGRAINDSAEGVEIGVHRGLRAGGVLGTADFGLSALNPFCTVILVESII
jgi:hypothetical protein